MENVIEMFLIEGERWKDFINELGNDRENGILNNLVVMIQNRNETTCEFSVDISYNVFENEHNVHENGIADYTIIINGIRRV